MFKFSITGVEETIADVDRRFDLMRDGVNDELGRDGSELTTEMIRTHTFQNRTYRLEGSIGSEVFTFMAGRASLRVFATMWYASLVEEGHPGPPPARPYPFFWPVWYAKTPGILERIREIAISAIEQGTLP